MIGLTSLTTSPSSVVSSRSTPCVAGWCGPMLIVKSSSEASASASITASVSETGWPSSRSLFSMETERSRSRSGTAVASVIPARELVLVEGEQHGLAADREVAPQWMALVVLGHEDAARVGVALEHHAEHVVDLALLEVRCWVQVGDRRQARVLGAHAGLHVQPLAAAHREQLVVD